jgi:hypothetical protein
MEMPHNHADNPDQEFLINPNQAREQILELWQDPDARALASSETGHLDTDHLAHIVSEKIAERRFDEAVTAMPNMTEDHLVYIRLQDARKSRAEYEQFKSNRPMEQPEQ